MKNNIENNLNIKTFPYKNIRKGIKNKNGKCKRNN
jgi:hypothetical protein